MRYNGTVMTTNGDYIMAKLDNNLSRFINLLVATGDADAAVRAFDLAGFTHREQSDLLARVNKALDRKVPVTPSPVVEEATPEPAPVVEVQATPEPAPVTKSAKDLAAMKKERYQTIKEICERKKEEDFFEAWELEF